MSISVCRCVGVCTVNVFVILLVDEYFFKFVRVSIYIYVVNINISLWIYLC